MNTVEEQQAFFKEHWPAMRTAAEERGAEGIIEYIQAREDDTERRVLFAFARMGLTNPGWEAGSFELLIEVSDAGIAEMLRQAQAAPDEETRAKRIDGANVISYNLSADLADCWPGDDTERSPEHYRRGLKAAKDCIHWREELGKGPGPFSMAYWAKGMHELSLGETAKASDSFATSYDFAKQSAQEAGETFELSPEAGFVVILGAGYLGLAQWAKGDPAGKQLYDQAAAAFHTQMQDEAKKDDAEFGMMQLEKVRARYTPGEANLQAQ